MFKYILDLLYRIWGEKLSKFTKNYWNFLSYWRINEIVCEAFLDFTCLMLCIRVFLSWIWIKSLDKYNSILNSFDFCFLSIWLR